MRTARIFVDQPLSRATNVIFDEGAARHVRQVLRLKRGAAVTLFNGQGGEFGATLLDVTRHAVKASVEAYVEVERESPLQIHLGQSLARGERMDIVIQKAVELGVTSITPLSTERSVVKLSAERISRRVTHWHSIAIHACQQCGRNRVPQINPVLDLPSWLQVTRSDVRLLLSPRAKQSLNNMTTAGEVISLLVGPEGGLSEREEAIAAQDMFVPVRCGPRVLRTETASLAGLTAIQLKWGDLG